MLNLSDRDASPEAAEPPPTPLRTHPDPSGPATRWARAIGRALRGDHALDEFADFVATAREPSDVEAALVRLVSGISRARRVVLVHGRDEDADRVACWPPDGPPGPSERPLELALRSGGQIQATLRLFPAPGRSWSPRTVRRLTTLCVLAASAARGLRDDRPTRPEPDSDGAPVLRDATFLVAILPYALAQARRHREPLSLFCVGIDRLAAIRTLHGPEAVDEAVGRVAGTILATLRASDVVARLDDDRLVVVLPESGASDSLRIAEAIRAAIALDGAATMTRAALTASIGVAAFPAHAHDVASLIAAADDAMAKAARLGRDRVVSAPPIAAPAAPGLARSVG